MILYTVVLESVVFLDSLVMCLEHLCHLRLRRYIKE